MEVDGNNEIEIEQTVKDEYTRICLLKTKHKIKYVDLFVSLNKQIDTQTCLVGVLLANNQFEIYSIDLKIKAINDESNLKHLCSIESAGHRTDVRTISFSSDSSAFLTASGDCLKVWNRLSSSCIRTLQCDYALCSAFLPDDNHVIIGCKSGKIQLFDINGAKLLENVSAHVENKEVWSISLTPDKNGFVSGSADHTVKFWNFELVDDEELETKKRLSFTHYRTLQLDDDVLSVCVTQNNRLVAVALLDSTVKVFFIDTLKLFLNLYGHKQPVLSLDVSFDNKLIVTGSADRHVKIWGLDFGDCHRSIFAHEDR
jgi:U3 small nucleolar RNA-associated protein 12